MKSVQIISYSGHKADESPRIFKLGDTLLPITQIEDRWYSPGETFFRVLTQTGDRYLLRYVEAQDVWTLEGFRSHRVDGVAQRAEQADED
jgi:hypothetical protein